MQKNCNQREGEREVLRHGESEIESEWEADEERRGLGRGKRRQRLLMRCWSRGNDFLTHMSAATLRSEDKTVGLRPVQKMSRQRGSLQLSLHWG